ncbi:DUF6443 domain-containing protein [Pedobacter lusitanus]
MKLRLLHFGSIFCALFLVNGFAYAQIPQDTVLDTYTGQTEITAKRRITLKSGFRIPAGKKVRIFTGAGFGTWRAIASNPSADQNYILTRVFKKPGIKDDAAAGSNGYKTSEVNQSIQYFDGLGRPLQTVTVQGSPSFADVVQPVVYDAFGREAVKYQPYAIGSNGGGYRGSGVTEQGAFYTTPPAGIAATANAYGVTVFESSPLNRVLEQGAPGAAWQPVSGNSTGHTQKIEYGTNAAEVKLWVVNATGASASSNYAAGTLYKTTTKDENWVAADLKAGTVDEYKDFEGRVVLKRVWESDAQGLSTYYVYDDLGNLRYVLPPGVGSISTFSESDDVYKQFIYGYHYDGRKRLVEKKIPGKGQESMVYNTLDQVILTRDANQGAGQWLFTKYDAFGRVVSSGIYSGENDRTTLQGVVNAQTVLWEKRVAGGIGYDNLSFPQVSSISSYHVINYYDDYSFPENTFGEPSGSQMKGDRVKSLLTGTKVTTLGTANMLLSVHYYDDEGRVIQSKSENHLGGKDIIDNTYNFAGELTASTRSHTTGSTTTEIANRYFYDHMGRKIATLENINNKGEVVLSQLDYTETGQLLKKQLHSTDSGSNYLQHTDYAYNERGWLNKATGKEFNLQLKYTEGDVPQWNGNISGQVWGRGEGKFDNTFKYSYDKLNRLTGAVSPGLGENIIYDVMGNIKMLNREGQAINNYSGYTGNQLTKIEGATNSTYSYDSNGNLITDSGKGITLTYNYLNLPEKVTGNKTLSYTYDATGNKLRKTSGSEVTDYIGGIQHKTDGSIDFIATEEGLARNNGGTYSYEYNLSDHLGNVRYSFNKHPVTGLIQQIQSDDYYAFGLRKVVSAGTNKYLYNKKELQEELEEYDYGARFYDPVIGRFTAIDPVAEHFPWMTSYQYGSNDPIKNIDLDGLEGLPFTFFFESTSMVPKLAPLAEAGAKYSAENITKAGGEFSGKTLESFRRGNATEAEQLSKNGLEKNYKPIKETDPKTGQEGKTIPDAFKNEGESTVEIKDVKNQSFTKQLRMQEKYSNDNGYSPELIINKGARLSEPLKKSSFIIKTYQISPTLKVDNVKVVSPVLVPQGNKPKPLDPNLML